MDQPQPQHDNQQQPQRAVYYLRTSSATNVDGDSEARQKTAIVAYAQRVGLSLVGGAWDQAVRGTDPIQDRPGLSQLLQFAQENGISLLLVETASRFSRDLIVQETGFQYLRSIGIDLVPVDSPEHFLGDAEDDPMRVAIRQILGVISQLEKSLLVKKLRGARERRRASSSRRTIVGGGKCEGRKSLAEQFPELPALALEISQRGGRHWTLAAISAELAQRGYLSPKTGKPIAKQGIKNLLTYAETVDRSVS